MIASCFIEFRSLWPSVRLNSVHIHTGLHLKSGWFPAWDNKDEWVGVIVETKVFSRCWWGSFLASNQLLSTFQVWPHDKLSRCGSFFEPEQVLADLNCEELSQVKVFMSHCRDFIWILIVLKDACLEFQYAWHGEVDWWLHCYEILDATDCYLIAEPVAKLELNLLKWRQVRHHNKVDAERCIYSPSFIFCRVTIPDLKGTIC